MRGNCNGVDSNSVHPPLKPISTTLSSMRANSSFRIFSSCHRSSYCPPMISTRALSSCNLFDNSSSWSSTLSRLLDCDRDERHVSPKINIAATEKRNPSARALAPFSMALASDKGRTLCLAGSPRMFVLNKISPRCMRCAKDTHNPRKRSCCWAWFFICALIGFAKVRMASVANFTVAICTNKTYE